MGSWCNCYIGALLEQQIAKKPQLMNLMLTVLYEGALKCAFAPSLGL